MILWPFKFAAVVKTIFRSMVSIKSALLVFLAPLVFLGNSDASNSIYSLHSGLRWHFGTISLRGGEGDATQRQTNFKRQISHEDITSEIHGAPNTADARVFAKADGEHRSLWHDLPLFEVSAKDGKPTGALHFVCEIPKYTRQVHNAGSVVMPIY
jgi:hypothetical protein